MADTSPPAIAADPATRGGLVIKERAITKIVTLSAAQVPGVSHFASNFSRLTGRKLPRAEVSVGTEAVSVNLYVALAWPARIDTVSSCVRKAVTNAVDELTGLPIHELNIVVAATTTSAANDDADTAVPVLDAGEPGSTRPARQRPRTPRALPAAVPAAIIIALLAIGLAIVATRELLIFHNAFDGAPWIQNTVEWAARLHWSEWIIPVVIASAAVGAVLVGAALKPRARTHVPVSASDEEPVVWMRPTDIARTTSSHAAAVAGVVSAHTTVTPKRVTVHVTANEISAHHDIEDAVRQAVEPGLAHLGTAPALRIKVRP